MPSPVELPVTQAKIIKTKTGALLLSGAALLVLGGCSGRDTAGSESLAAMNAAAERAEKAADRSEAAWTKIEKAIVPEADPDATEDAADAAEADVEGPVSTEPDIKS